MKNKQPYYHGASEKIFENALKLRKNLTEAEKILWNSLKNRKVSNCKFRRQHPIGRFIADFYCHEVKLIIEADGAIHNSNKSKEYDKGRTEMLNEWGIEVLRFSNDQIITKPLQVIKSIEEIIKNKRAKNPTPY